MISPLAFHALGRREGELPRIAGGTMDAVHAGMLAWVGVVFAVLLLAGCLYDAVKGSTAEALYSLPR